MTVIFGRRPAFLVLVWFLQPRPRSPRMASTSSAARTPTVFGNCVPSLEVENKSAETIDYLQVDVAVSLGNGQERTVELKSAYREGVLYPIQPGGKAVLKQHLDTSMALGVGCGDVKSHKGRPDDLRNGGRQGCASSVSVQP